MKGFIVFFLFFSLFFTDHVEASENPQRSKGIIYHLSVSFDIEQNLIKGKALIEIPQNNRTDISFGSLDILSVTFNGSSLRPDMKKGVVTVNEKGTLEITYERRFKINNAEAYPDKKDDIRKNFIDKKGIWLTDEWYPDVGGQAFYKLKALIPSGFVAVSEADTVTVTDNGHEKEYLFDFPYSVRSISIVAGKYVEVKKSINEIDIYAYSSPENIFLTSTFIEYAERYLKMYGELLTPYPYRRFSVIENFLPIGDSRPTFTLLSKDIMPSLSEKFLMREILRQWLVNSVYVDYKKGNWSEGLTTYLSDHYVEEQKGSGWRFRKKLIADYESHVNPDKEIPLKQLTTVSDFSSKAIGCGKGAMLFHMLKKLIGDDHFYSGLKEFIRGNEFREASWDDLRITFENTSGKNLDPFFDQWLNRKGVPGIEIIDTRVIVLKGVPTVSLELIQKGEPYSLDIGLMIRTDKGEIKETVKLEKERELFEIPVQENVLEVIFDGQYDVMRKLAEKENPVVLSRLFGYGKKYIITSDEDTKKYGELIKIFKREGYSVQDEMDITDEDIKRSSLIILGLDNLVLKRLFGGIKDMGCGFVFSIKRNPLNASEVIAVAHTDAKEEVDLSAEKLLHYGEYTFMRFEKGKSVEKKIDDSEDGMKVSVYKPVIVIQPKKINTIDEIIHTILDKSIIYVGERHTNYEDHRVQLKIIMSLYESGRKFAIGMEMFQKPFQKVIDDYLSGTISEREFLKATQYFKRWQFDYNLYREIIEFAKAKNIPVIALNQWSEIVKKVATEGIDGLTDIERGEIPRDMDMSDEEYKERLRAIFERHKNLEIKNVDYFYQSQIIWDETMSHTIDDFLKKNPDYQMVVIAGVGHIMYGYGIPQRVYRLNGKEYTILIPDIGDIDESIGNFVFLPAQQSAPLTLKLGVFLKQTDKGVRIEKIVPGSIAKAAGLKKGDILLYLDDWMIEEIDDVKIFMFDKRRGEDIKIKVLRKGFLFGYKEHEFSVTL